MFNSPFQQQQPVIQLPYNPQGFQTQPLAININNLPVNVAVLGNSVHPNLLQYLPSIAVATIDTLQTRAQQNALRMFLYNQLSSNQYNNENFLLLIKVICDIAEYYAASGVNLEQAITSSIDISVQFAAFNNLKSYNALMQYIDQNTMNNLSELDKKQNQLTLQVTQYQQQKLQRQNQAQMMPFNPVPQANGWGLNNNGVNNNFFSAPAQDNMVKSWNTGSQNTSGWKTPEQNNKPSWEVTNKPVWEAPTQTKVTENIQPNKQESVVEKKSDVTKYAKVYNYDGKVMVKQRDPGVVWVPSERWPVNISDSRFVDVYYVIHSDGSMEPIIKKLTKEEQMEKSKHLNTLVYRPESNKSWDSVLKDGKAERVSDMVERFEKRELNMISGGTHNRRDETLKDEEIVKDNAHLIITSEEEAFHHTDIAMNISDTLEKPCTAYSKPAIRVTTILFKTKSEAFLSSLCESVSLEQCASKLRVESYEIASISDKREKRDRRAVFGKINRMLTNSVNKYLKYQLCLPNVKIDSFEADGSDIVKYLEDKYPSNYAQSLRKHQKQIIVNVLATTKNGAMGSDFDDCVREQQLFNEDVNNCEPIFLYSREVYMSVNEFSDTLQILLDDPDDVLSVYQDANPLIYSMCHHLVGKNEDDVFAYYIKTVDDVIYEVQRSALSEGVYVIGLKK